MASRRINPSSNVTTHCHLTCRHLLKSSSHIGPSTQDFFFFIYLYLVSRTLTLPFLTTTPSISSHLTTYCSVCVCVVTCMLVQPVDSYTLQGVIVTPIKTPFGLDITLELLYSCSNYNEFSYRNSFILHIVFAGLLQNDLTDILSRLNCPAPPNKSIVISSEANLLTAAICVIHSLHFGLLCN